MYFLVEYRVFKKFIYKRKQNIYIHLQKVAAGYDVI
jgi:hypothetical protein